MTNDHPLGPEKAVFSGRWSLVRGLHRTKVRPSVPGAVVCHDKRPQKPNHRREETSRYTAPKTPKSAPGLVGRPRVTVYYIGSLS